MSKEPTSPTPTLEGRKIQLRPFYPANLKPVAAELKAHARGKRKWFPHHKEIWRRTQAYRLAKAYLSKPHYKQNALIAGGGFLLIGLASFFGWTDPISRAMRSGFTLPTGAMIPRVNPLGVGLLLAQGAASIFGFLRLTERRKRIQAEMTKDRFEDWIRREEVKQDDIQKVLTPAYVEPNPYNPTDPSITVVLGEHYDNDAHKFGVAAHWYVMKMKGLQTGGVIIFGITGAGKTSSTLRPIMRQMFGWMAAVDFDPDNRGREKVAGFVLDPKGALPPEVKSVLMSAGVDPILDPAQVSANGPANITAVYHLLHQRKAQGAEPSFDPEIIQGYRGRADDYLELGYDAARVDRVWTHLQKLQDAAKALLNTEALEGTDGSSVRQGLLTYAKLPAPNLPPNHAQAKDGAQLLRSFLRGESANQFTRAGLGELEVSLQAVPWEEKGLSAAVSGLGADLESLLAWSWVAREQAVIPASYLGSLKGAGSVQRPEIHPQAPGTPFSQAYTLDAYAVGRNQVRRLAPLKVRPTCGMNEYRDAWAMRELRMWQFREGQVALAARAESKARFFALAQLAKGKDDHAESQESFATHLAEDLHLLTSPLDALLGPESVAWEYGRAKAKPSPALLKAIDRVKSGLSADLSDAFREGDYQRLTVPLSERPGPLPVGASARKRLKGRYASSDPLVDLVMEASAMRKREGELLKQAVGAAARDLEAAATEVSALAKDAAARVERFTSTQHIEFALPMTDLLMRMLEALVTPRGGRNGLLQDGLAAILGMPCFPPRSEQPLLNDFLFLGDELGYAAPGLAYAAIHPQVEDLTRGLRTGIDATHADWVQTHITSVTDAAVECMTSTRIIKVDPEVMAQTCGLIREAVTGLLDTWAACNLSALEAALEGPLKKQLAELGRDQAPLFRRAAKLARRGAFQASVDNPLARSSEERLKATAAGASPNADWCELLWSKPVNAGGARRGPYWRGVMSGLDMTPLHASQWDEVWGFLGWRSLIYSLAAGKQIGAHTFATLADLAARLGNYQMAALEAYTVSVAPNIAWRCDGPYTYNPLYAPDLMPIVVAGTFNETIFAATSKGKDNSDPFWENASFTVIYNLLMLCNLVDGYATFPRIYNLAANEPVLKEYLAVIQRQQTARTFSVEDTETVVKILTWAHSEWLTEASAKSETKDNIIRSLSVVSEGFKDPKFAFCFAPTAKEDISFPSWTWVMREGKVVAANLPLERYEKVASVVLPLANKTFQKAVQMRDGARKENERIQETSRGRIEALERQVEEIAERIEAESAERLSLSLFFTQGRGRSALRDGSSLGSLAPSQKVFSRAHPLAIWRGFQMNDEAGAQFSLADDLVSKVSNVEVKPIGMAALVAAAQGFMSPFKGVYHTLPRVTQSWVEAGVFLRVVSDLRPGRTLGERAAEGHETAKKALTFLAEAISKLEDEEKSALGLKEGQVLDPRQVPGILAEPIGRVLDREMMVRLTGRMENLAYEHRSLERPAAFPTSGEAGKQAHEKADALASGGAHRPRARVLTLYREIRAEEERIASMPNTERTVAYVVDEAHFFVQGKADADYVTVARSNNAVNFYSTQAPSNLYAKMGEETARQFLDSLPNRIILRMPDSKAAESCAEFLGGKKRQRVIERSVSHSFEDMRANGQEGGGQGKSTGGSVSVNIKHEERWIVDLNQIINLRAMEAFAFVWNGKENTPPTRVFMKPDYLFVVPEIRCYQRAAGSRYADIPKDYEEGMDLYALTVPRLLDIGVIDASR